MHCPLCLCFLQDTLESNNLSTNLSCKKLHSLSGKIAGELHRLLTTIQNHHNMVLRVKKEYLNLVEKKIHTPAKSLEMHLYDVSANYYKWVDVNKQKGWEFEQTIQLLCYELLSNGVFKLSRATDPLLPPKQWLLEKYFFFLEHLKDIHIEHSKKNLLDVDSLVFLKTERISDSEIESWGNLYD